MTKIVKAILLVLLPFVCGVRADAKTVTANSCSAPDVQAATNQTSAGDTVAIPGGSATWNTTVTIDSSHQITLNGGGCTVTWGSSGGLSVTAGTANNTEITNFTFNGSFTGGNCPMSFTTSLSPVSLAFRFYNNTLDGGNPGAPGTIICTHGNGPGLFDHNSFTTHNGADEVIHVLGNGAGDDSGWRDLVTFGGPNAIYLEDNTFTCTNGSFFSSALESYYGARTVVRHNTLINSEIDQHGNGIGARLWEFYNNTLSDPHSIGSAQFCIRAGSGMIFGNSGDTAIRMTQENGTYPALYQVGQGQLQGGAPSNCSKVGPPGCVHAYVWNDVVPSLNTTQGCAAGNPNMIAFERDVYAQGDGGNGVRTGTYASRPGTCTPYQGYWATDQNQLYVCMTTNSWTSVYTPYTYPHPLIQGQNDPPDPPSNLNAISQ